MNSHFRDALLVEIKDARARSRMCKEEISGFTKMAMTVAAYGSETACRAVLECARDRSDLQTLLGNDRTPDDEAQYERIVNALEGGLP